MSKSGGTVVRSGAVVGTLPTVAGLRQIGQHVTDDRVKAAGQQQMQVVPGEAAATLPLAHAGLRQAAIGPHDGSVPVVAGVEPYHLEHATSGKIVRLVQDRFDLRVVADPTGAR